jgi:hypothetical protein
MQSLQLNLETIDTRERFWQMADMTKAAERYKIDRNLQYLKVAPLETLKKIFIQYRYFTHYYITDMAILISRLPFGQLRSILADILHEELGMGDPLEAHPALYDDFLASLGISRQEMMMAEPACLQNLQQIQNSLLSRSWAYGIGLRGMGGECLCQIYLSTMHEYFSQNLAILSMSAGINWKFWDIHIGEVDLHHQQIVRSAIDDLIQEQPDTIQDLIGGYQESKTAWDHYWEHIFRAARSQPINRSII